jgi:hypothetical protein
MMLIDFSRVRLARKDNVSKISRDIGILGRQVNIAFGPYDHHRKLQTIHIHMISLLRVHAMFYPCDNLDDNSTGVMNALYMDMPLSSSIGRHEPRTTEEQELEDDWHHVLCIIRGSTSSCINLDHLVLFHPARYGHYLIRFDRDECALRIWMNCGLRIMEWIRHTPRDVIIHFK